MKEKLQPTPCLTARGMHKGLCIFLLMICGAAQSQPTMLSRIPNESKNFIHINGRLYYSVQDSLKTATATTAPTLVAKTNEPILRIYDITVGTNFFFVTQTGSGQRLWRSDGTNAIQVMAETEITPLLSYQSQLFMRVNSATTGVELWKMDGAYNVSLLKDINPGPANGFMGSLISHNDLLYFFADAGNDTHLWQSDGTTAGTVLSADLGEVETYSSSGFKHLTSVNDIMFFTRDYQHSESGEQIAELWKSDGSAEGTSVVTQYSDYGTHNAMSHFLAFNGKLYFFHSIGDPAYVYLSVSDGTASGTQHLNQVTIDGFPRKLIDADSYFLYYADGQSYTTSLMKSDGTTSTPVHGWSMYHSTSDEFINLTYTEGRAFFTDDTGEYYGGGLDLWQADLASGVTRPVEEIYDMPFGGVENIVAAEGSIFFTKREVGHKTLWHYDPSASPSSCEVTGNIFQEIWSNVTGTDVQAFDFSTPPDGDPRSFTSFETTQYYANNYASRMRGWICVPQSGLYTFWISSDDQSELYLSPDPSEENINLIARVYGHTSFRDYDKYTSQKSRQIPLQAGRKYYIEVRHKEGNGNDFISVGWQLPDGTMERPISGNRLIAMMPGEEEEPCTGTGTIVREIWTGISGTSVSSIPVNSPPNTTVELTSLSTPNYYGNDYGSRIRGYVCVPQTGAYTFWIAGDDNCELWLSSYDDPAGKSRIAHVPGHTRVNEWTKYSAQQSAPVNLVQGQRYYIEVLHKEGNGADHVEVGWQLPSGTFERPITGNRLIPFDDPSTSAAMFAANDVFSFEDEGTVSISPNPVISGKQVFINLPGAGDEEVHVDIKSITGVSVQNEMLWSDSDAVVVDLSPSLAAGMYLIRVSNDRKRWSTKLQVK